MIVLLCRMSRLFSAQNIEQIRLTGRHRRGLALWYAIRINIIWLIGIVCIIGGLCRVVEAIGSKLLLMLLLLLIVIVVAAQLQWHKAASRRQRCSIVYNILLLILMHIVLNVILLLLLVWLDLLVVFVMLVKDACARLWRLAIQCGIEGGG